MHCTNKQFSPQDLYIGNDFGSSSCQIVSNEFLGNQSKKIKNKNFVNLQLLGRATSLINSWSMSHIYEYEFYCIGHLWEPSNENFLIFSKVGIIILRVSFFQNPNSFTHCTDVETTVHCILISYCTAGLDV